VAASTQNQALAALLFLFEHVLERPLDRIEGVVRARGPKRLPVVLTRDEVEPVLSEMDSRPVLVCSLLYGSGLRLTEGLSLRTKDLDFGRGTVTIRDGKGQKDRVTMLPGVLQQPLRDHLRQVREQHDSDLKVGLDRAPLPDALARKFPHGDREWAWQWVFPASSHYLDRRTGVRHRYHLHGTVIQKAVRQALRQAGLTQHATSHTFRHSFATHLLHLLEDGYDIRTVQELLGHRDVKTTMIYTHVLNRGGRGVNSPLRPLTAIWEDPLACLLAAFALLMPRLAVALLWFFSHWFDGLFTSLLWPILGFVFLPTTLLWYSAVQHWFGGTWTLWPVVGIVVALLIDLSPARHHRRFF